MENDARLLLMDLYVIIQKMILKGKLPKVGESCFWVIGLGQQQELLLMEQLSASGLEELQAIDVFQVALQKQVNTVLLCQYCYDRAWMPKEKDYCVIWQLLEVGHLINLPLLDYLILRGEDYYSLVQSGDFKQVWPSKEQLPLSVEEAEFLAQEAVEQAKYTLEAIYYQDKEDIALYLYKDGVALERIMEITGLSEATLLLLLDTS